MPAKFPGHPRFLSLRNPRKTNFRGRARTFRPPPLRVEDPPPLPGGLRTPKVNLCALFSCLNRKKISWRTLRREKKFVYQHRVAPKMFMQRRKSVYYHHRKKIFWGTFLASKKNFPGRRWIHKPYENQENHIYHRNLSSVAPFFSAKKSSALEQGGVCFCFPSLWGKFTGTNDFAIFPGKSACCCRRLYCCYL